MEITAAKTAEKPAIKPAVRPAPEKQEEKKGNRAAIIITVIVIIAVLAVLTWKIIPTVTEKSTESKAYVTVTEGADEPVKWNIRQ